jgi:hypothetical protein
VNIKIEIGKLLLGNSFSRFLSECGAFEMDEFMRSKLKQEWDVENITRNRTLEVMKQRCRSLDINVLIELSKGE